MGVNRVTLVGHVGRDPELKTLPTGTTIATFSLATTDRRRKDDQGNPATEWHRIVAWQKLAEIVGQYVRKGSLLYLEGSIRTRKWEQDGQTKYSTEIHVDQMEMLGGRVEQSGHDSDRRNIVNGMREQFTGDYPDDVPF